MSYKIILSRELPLPPLFFGGEPIEVCVYHPGDAGMEGAQVYCTTALDKTDAALIDDLPKSVGLIANIGIGTDGIDLVAAKAKGLNVSNTHVAAEDTADLAFALILSASRRVTVNEKFARSGMWSADQPLAEIGQSVHGKTLGILGFGQIGQAVARRAQGFGMRVIYHGPNPKPDVAGANYEPDLDVFLSQIDILSLHCPLTPQTQHILNAESLANLKKGVVIVNTGRGGLIDENALVAALETGHIGAAGLDVFEDEPNIHPGLLKLENVTLTPHMGSATHEGRTQMGMRAIGNILNFLETGSPIDRVI